MPEHRVRLLQVADDLGRLAGVGEAVVGRRLEPAHLGLEVLERKELVQRRIEQADRHRQAAHLVQDRREVGALELAELLERLVELARARSRAPAAPARRRRPPGTSARRQRAAATNIPRTSSPRSSPKNMCSVRQRPIPSAPSERALAASSAVSALARTPSRRSSSDQRSTSREVARSISGSISGTSSAVTLPVVPSIAIRSPAASSISPIRTTPRLGVDLDLGGAGDARAAHAAGDERRVRGLAALGGEDSAGGVEPGDVVGLGERADQDHVLAVGRRGARPRRR